MNLAYLLANGQSKVMNRCLEHYLISSIMDFPQQWPKYLPLLKSCFNTSFHTISQMTPFKTLDGRKPPKAPNYVQNFFKVQAIDRETKSRDEILRVLIYLKHNNKWSSQLMKEHRYRVIYGRYCLIKLQPYCQTTLINRFSLIVKVIYWSFQSSFKSRKAH